MSVRRAVLVLFVFVTCPAISFGQNPYYDHGSFPSPGSPATSAGMRAELDLIEAGFNKLPVLTGNADELVVVNGSATALTTVTADNIFPKGETFPSSPSVNQLFLLTTDTSSGDCVPGGSARTLCYWNGTDWVAVSSASGLSGLDANFDITDGNKITGSSEAKRFEVLDAGGTNGVVIYWHSSGKAVVRCLVASVEGACDSYVELNAGKKWGVKNSGGTVFLEADEATSALTSATIDCSSASIFCTVYNTKEFELVGCQAGVAGHIWNTPSTNAPAAACDPTNTNTIKGYASFDDTTDEYIDASMRLPAGYVPGSLEFIWHWKATETAGAAGFCTQIVRVPDGTTSDQALPAQGTGNCVSDAAKGTTLQENRATNTNPNCTSCTGGDELKLRFSRDANGSAVTDSMTGDAHVMKVIARWEELQ